VPSHILGCLQRIVSRLKESRVLTLNPEPAFYISALRWVTLLFYGWLGAVVVHLLWPWLSYLRPESLFSLQDQPILYLLLQLTWILVAVLLVLKLQAKFFIRFPRKKNQSFYCIDIVGFARYPTLHVSVLAGIFMLLEFLNVAEKETLIFPGLDGDGLVIFLGLYTVILILGAAYQRLLRGKKTEQFRSKETLNLMTCSDQQFEDWIKQERDEKTLDFFDREPYVERMLARIKQATGKESQQSKGQILLGEFGSGKTTIVNLMEKELDPEWIVLRFDCWQRSGKPEELAAQLMEQIIHDVGQQFEAASLVGLPESFASALYGSSHWWHLLDIWLRPDTPEKVIERLNNLLKVNNRKLLLVIENVDRNEEREYFFNIVAAILDKLKQTKDTSNIHFIFSADEEKLDTTVVYRIADYKERVATFISPELLIRFMALCLDSALNRQKNGESLIIPYLSKDFLLPADTQGKISAVRNALALRADDEESKPPMYSEESTENQVLMALTGILSNPRRLKHVLRNMYQLWMDELKGEVNLFDLLLYVAANDEGSIREGMKKFTPDILEGSGDGPFTANYKRMLRETSGEDTNDIPTYDDADFIAFYLLNGDLGHGQPCRKHLCQPVIDRGGLSEDVFEKYRKIVDTGTGKGYASSDQELLKNYIKASAKTCDQQALMACLNFALSSPNNLVIFENLLISMTKTYFASVTELYRFTHRAIILADQRYAGTINGVINPLIQLCFSVMNFDRSGGEKHAVELEEQLIAALKQLGTQWQYTYQLRVLTFVIRAGEHSLRAGVIKAVARSVFSPEHSVRIGLRFRANDKGTHELQYEYGLLLPALNEVRYIVDEKTVCEAYRSFLIVTGMRLKDDPGMLKEFKRVYPNGLEDVKKTIKDAVKVETLEGIEKNAWQELLRVLPDSKNADDSQSQDK